MKKICPKCGREGYEVIKLVTGSTGFRMYACLYFKHRDKPIWCYIKRLPELDPPINYWSWSTKYLTRYRNDQTSPP
jgi:hypothetical protein